MSSASLWTEYMIFLAIFVILSGILEIKNAFRQLYANHLKYSSCLLVLPHAQWRISNAVIVFDHYSQYLYIPTQHLNTVYFSSFSSACLVLLVCFNVVWCQASFVINTNILIYAAVYLRAPLVKMTIIQNTSPHNSIQDFLKVATRKTMSCRYTDIFICQNYYISCRFVCNELCILQARICRYVLLCNLHNIWSSDLDVTAKKTFHTQLYFTISVW